MELFTEGKPFYKGNLHCHTTCSDGHKPPEEVIEIYRAMGYDFLAITDHRKVTVAQSHLDGSMLLLPGIELDYTLPEEVVHIIGFGMGPEVQERVNYQLGPQGGINAIRACGGRAIVAHPHWSLNTMATLQALHGAAAAEVYNSTSTIPWNADRCDSSAILDVTAAHGTLYPLVAADDSHRYEGEQGQGFTMVQADELTAEGIMAAMDAGRFYASRGPRFEQISLENGVLRVRCSPVKHIVFVSNLVWAMGRCISGEALTTGEYYIAGPQERFVRVQLVDAEGRSAWSSPIALA